MADKKATEDKNEDQKQTGSDDASHQEKNKDDKKTEQDGDKTPKTDASADEKKGDEIDYKAELEATQKQLGQAEHTIETLKKTKKSKKVEKTEDDEEDDEADQPDPVLTEIIEDRVVTTLDSLTDDPDKKKLIRLHYDRSIVKTGSSREAIKNDLENALALTERPRLVKENSELKQTVKTKKSITNSGQGNNQDKDDDSTEEVDLPLSDADKAIMKRYGLTKEQVIANRS